MTRTDFRIVALLLGALAIIGLVGVLVLAGLGRTIPEPLWAIIGSPPAALGALYIRPPSGNPAPPPP